MDIDIKIYIRNGHGSPFIGRGTVLLIEQVQICGSLRKAALKIGMSYSKAHKIIKNLEKETGEKILEMSIGGSGGGGARLTDFSIKFTEEFKKLDTDIRSYSQRRFEKMGFVK